MDDVTDCVSDGQAYSYFSGTKRVVSRRTIARLRSSGVSILRTIFTSTPSESAISVLVNQSPRPTRRSMICSGIVSSGSRSVGGTARGGVTKLAGETTAAGGIAGPERLDGTLSRGAYG